MITALVLWIATAVADGTPPLGKAWVGHDWFEIAVYADGRDCLRAMKEFMTCATPGHNPNEVDGLILVGGGHRRMVSSVRPVAGG